MSDLSNTTLSPTEQIKRDVAINISDLDGDMVGHASMYVHYAMKTVAARRSYDGLKNTSEIRQAQLFAKHRSALLAEGAKATEAMIDAAVKTDVEYIKAQTDLINAQAAWRLAEVAESAFVQRKDMILELARDRRKEREGQLRVLEQEAGKNNVMTALKEFNGSKN